MSRTAVPLFHGVFLFYSPRSGERRSSADVDCGLWRRFSFFAGKPNSCEVDDDGFSRELPLGLNTSLPGSSGIKKRLWWEIQILTRLKRVKCNCSRGHCGHQQTSSWCTFLLILRNFLSSFSHDIMNTLWKPYICNLLSFFQLLWNIFVCSTINMAVQKVTTDFEN